MVQKFEYKKATLEDIDELVRTRIIVLRVANKLSDEEDMSVAADRQKPAQHNISVATNGSADYAATPT